MTLANKHFNSTNKSYKLFSQRKRKKKPTPSTYAIRYKTVMRMISKRSFEIDTLNSNNNNNSSSNDNGMLK